MNQPESTQSVGMLDVCSPLFDNSIFLRKVRAYLRLYLHDFPFQITVSGLLLCLIGMFVFDAKGRNMGIGSWDQFLFTIAGVGFLCTLVTAIWLTTGSKSCKIKSLWLIHYRNLKNLPRDKHDLRMLMPFISKKLRELAESHQSASYTETCAENGLNRKPDGHFVKHNSMRTAKDAAAKAKKHLRDKQGEFKFAKYLFESYFDLRQRLAELYGHDSSVATLGKRDYLEKS